MDKPPKRYKRTSFFLFLILAVACLMAGVSKLLATNIYEQAGWWRPMLLALFLGFIAVLLYRRNRAADRAFDAAIQTKIDKEMPIQEKLRAEQTERERRQLEWEATHGRIMTNLAGVTFENEDGSSRQRALQSAMADEGIGAITLELYEYKGKDAIRVEYEGVGVGNIPQNRVAEVSAVLNRITAAELHVNRFVPEDEDDKTRGLGGVIYRADLTIVYTKP